ncbi:hypothetical protein BBO_07275 [Beauveria brongniartii RCEF 3172]|uniref:Uncharacterized protein n=1 Tax=Beauveria brongniartii RCEF 3172 TaxID=1081107 RepID=A0A166ZUW4_9HYPO|nr:hypothetical protein BBO_07275 [Beauveria brongniartii RCEF 3172]
MPSHHPCSLTPLPLIFIADSGPPGPGSSSHEINIRSHAESHSTHDGGFVYSSHTTITSESTPLPLPPPPPYLPLPPVYGHHLPPSRQMSTVSSRGPRLALPPPPSIGPPPPPSYVSSPYTYTRSRSAAPSYASSSSRTARPDSFYTPSQTTTTTATGSSRRYPPVSSRGRSRLPQQVLMLGDGPPSSVSSQRRSRYSSVQDESTVAPESSVSNQTYNAERAARRDMEARGRASRRSSSQCR